MELIGTTSDLGKIIRVERKRQGYTQAEMAGLCNIGVTYVSNLENGKESAEIGKAIYILQMLGIDLMAAWRTP